MMNAQVSKRGVVFFRAQNDLTNDRQKELVDRLGRMTNKPVENSLHVHPVLNSSSGFGVGDRQMSHISTASQKHMFEQQRKLGQPRRYDAAKWHSDIQFEPHPADIPACASPKYRRLVAIHCGRLDAVCMRNSHHIIRASSRP